MTKQRTVPNGPRALAFDLAYSLRSLRASGHERHITQRDLDGYFDHVYTVYPLLGIDPGDDPKPFPGTRRLTPLTARHTFIEQAAYPYSRLPKSANLATSQVSLIRYCCALVLREKIDIIRGTEPFLTGTLARIVARITGRPYCIRLGSNFDALAADGILPFPRIFMDYRYARFVGQRTLRSCDLLLPANENYRAYAIANGARADRTLTIPYGSVIAEEHFTPPDTRGARPPDFPATSGPVLLVVGRLLDVKRPFDVLDVAALVRQQIPDVVVAFVGEGPLREALELKARQMDLGGTVSFLGARNQDWLCRAYPHASVYVSPLTGRALAEAALGGLPAVAYDCDWHSELVKTGVTGELVDNGDIEAMAQGVVGICKQPSYREKLGENARQAAIEMMSPGVLRDREREAFDNLLGLTKSGPGD